MITSFRCPIRVRVGDGFQDCGARCVTQVGAPPRCAEHLDPCAAADLDRDLLEAHLVAEHQYPMTLLLGRKRPMTELRESHALRR